MTDPEETPHSAPEQQAAENQIGEALKGLRGALAAQPEGQGFFASPKPVGGAIPPDTAPGSTQTAPPPDAPPTRQGSGD